MKKICAISLKSLFILLLSSTNCFGQEDLSDDTEQEQETLINSSSDYPVREQSQSIWPNNTRQQNAIRSDPNRSAQRPNTLEAPPDCPECLPDPGGDLNDVPFDRNLLFILFGGAFYIVFKVFKRVPAVRNN